MDAMKQTASTTQRRRTGRRGFSLIEAAIVVGVVGLVVGGIWSAANTYKERCGLNQIYTFILQIHSLYNSWDSRQIAQAYPIIGYNNAGSAYIDSALGQLPPGFAAVWPTTFSAPLDINLDVRIIRAATGSSILMFYIQGDVSPSRCMKIVSWILSLPDDFVGSDHKVTIYKLEGVGPAYRIYQGNYSLDDVICYERSQVYLGLSIP